MISFAGELPRAFWAAADWTTGMLQRTVNVVNVMNERTRLYFIEVGLQLFRRESPV